MHEHLHPRENATVISGPFAIQDVTPIPWKNGGGLTRTIAQHPAQADLESFIWRVSLAEIHASGSFSPFPGIDRTILLWSGEGLVLRSHAWPEQRLSMAARPFAFDGEAHVSCKLIGGPSQDLNLMVRRGAAVAAMHASTELCRIEGRCDELIVLCAQGSLRLLLNDRSAHTMHNGTYLRVSDLNEAATLEPLDPATRFAYIAVRFQAD